MVFQEGLELPQGQGLHDRVNANISKSTGHLEDQTLDMDVRTMAILGKKQELRVRSPAPNRTRQARALIRDCAEKLWAGLPNRFFDDTDSVVGVYCLV